MRDITGCRRVCPPHLGIQGCVVRSIAHKRPYMPNEEGSVLGPRGPPFLFLSTKALCIPLIQNKAWPRVL